MPVFQSRGWDTQANIKAQNPNATFGEVSKIVASMWDGLGEEQKQEYLKQLAAYRASLVSQVLHTHTHTHSDNPSSWHLTGALKG
uniref:HMG box domain-containing protein n=1 Tax=Cyclopterus lumpus TaxID=8103 RepID=A0A8C3AH31_CYCLU